MGANKTIFHLEERGALFIGHWFQFMISGLRHVNKKIIHANDSTRCINQNLSLYKKEDVKPPYYIHVNKSGDHFEDFQLQTFDLIKDDFIFVEDIKEDDIVVNNYGEEVIYNKISPIYGESSKPVKMRMFHDINGEGWIYLKKLLKIEISDTDNKKYNKKYYICRSKSNSLSGNIEWKTGTRRQIINENDLIKVLAEYDIESIFLEDYSVIEKIKLFSCAKLIISPNSSGMIFSLFLDKNSRLVEINTHETNETSAGGRIWESLCQIFKIPYYLYFAEKIDIQENMKIDINDFIEFMKKYKL